MPLDAGPAEAADTLAALYPALAACWQPPEALAGQGAEVTARFSLRRDGSLIGAPRIVFAAGVSGEGRRRLARATLAAVKACTPARITPDLGRAIAGRPIALRLVYQPQGR